MTKEKKLAALFNGDYLYFNEARVSLFFNNLGETFVDYQDNHQEEFSDWLLKVNLDEWSVELPENKKEYIHVYLDSKGHTCVTSKTLHKWNDYMFECIDPSDVEEFIKTIEI